jgi:hypothetical protein
VDAAVHLLGVVDEGRDRRVGDEGLALEARLEGVEGHVMGLLVVLLDELGQRGLVEDLVVLQHRQQVVVLADRRAQLVQLLPSLHALQLPRDQLRDRVHGPQTQPVLVLVQVNGTADAVVLLLLLRFDRLHLRLELHLAAARLVELQRVEGIDLGDLLLDERRELVAHLRARAAGPPPPRPERDGPGALLPHRRRMVLDLEVQLDALDFRLDHLLAALHLCMATAVLCLLRSPSLRAPAGGHTW